VKIIEILPELNIGGVERHVVELSAELSSRGHEVLVISSGGGLTGQLSAGVEHRTLPVSKKNPFSVFSCAREISSWIKNEGWQIVHAHSRAPAWIADIASSRAHVPFIVTAHCDFGNKSPWIYRPYRRAAKTICVSSAVQEAMKNCFFKNTQVILNGLPQPPARWTKPAGKDVKFLFVGRLSSVKGLQDIIKALPEDGRWLLDVLGDGPMRNELEELRASLSLEPRVTFHGNVSQEECDEYMTKCTCLVFPSYKEGMPLTLARAVQIGIPVIASDIPPVAEMCLTPERLLPPGDAALWGHTLRQFLRGGYETALWKEIPTLAGQVDAVEEIYFEQIGKK